MSRLAPLDRALFLILVPLWVVFFVLGVRTQVQGVSATLIGLSVEDADHYPALTGEFSSVSHLTDPLVQAGLRAGDRLIRLGNTDLLGIDTAAFAARSLDEPGSKSPLVFERDGDRRETLLALDPVSNWRPLLATSFAFAASAIFLLLRGRPTPTVRALFYSGMTFAFANCAFPGSRLEFYAWLSMAVASNILLFPLAFAFVYRFPDDRVPAGGWHRIWPWFFAVQGVSFFLMFTSRMAIGEVTNAFFGSLGTLALAVVATRKYRRSDLVARRQMKWILFGIYCAALPFAVASGLTALDSRFGALYFLSFWALPLFPLSLVISVVRFNLFDIDRLLSAAASYNLLLVLLVGGGLVVVPRLAEAASGLVGIDPGTGQIALSLGLAAVLIPAHRRLRPQIDRVFFKERYALDHGIAELLGTLPSCADAHALTERVGAGLQRLLRPEACVVYAAVESSYVPVFVEGRAVPPSFAPGSPLVASLGERLTPLSLGDAGRRPDEAALGPFDRAALETLGAEVVVPVRRDDALAGFVCLGPKRSGDVYTSTDLSLLGAVAESVSHQLQRFGQDEVIREGRAMQESLRRYVPGAVAEQLASGAELASGEREVSVLFVDIRGYTGFSESRGAEEIFSTVNRYTETVSQIVQRHAGSVVEFNGDGMMAVFGAPRELAHKERAAVEAGREIVMAVSALPIEPAPQGREAAAPRAGDERSQPARLAVGVGIATGKAFVGNIQAVDRMIWSAIGNTTNLAARLQSLTRELAASLVIDAVTWQRAQPTAADFEKRPDVAIRGRRETQDLYALPMRSDS